MCITVQPRTPREPLLTTATLPCVSSYPPITHTHTHACTHACARTHTHTHTPHTTHSGETAFYYMQIPIGWAKRPMMERIGTDLSPSIPLTFIYGARSWMDSSTGERVKELRPHSYVCVHYVRRAGHHVHADQPDAFNAVVREVCFLVDRNEDIESSPHSMSENVPGGPHSSSENVPGPHSSSENVPGPHSSSENVPGPHSSSENVPGPHSSSENVPGPHSSSENVPGPHSTSE